MTIRTPEAAVVALDDRRPLDRRGWRRPTQTLPGRRSASPPANKGVRYDKIAPKPVEVQQFLDAIDVSRRAGRRLRAAAAVMYRTGMRVKELTEPEERDVLRSEGLLYVRFGKSRVPKPRHVGLDAWGWRELDAWLEVRSQLPPGPVFYVVAGPTTGRREWQTEGIREEFRKTCASARLRVRLSPHSLRHAYAMSLLLDPTMTSLDIQRTLGHADLRTTEIYLSAFTDRMAALKVAARSAPMVPIAQR